MCRAYSETLVKPITGSAFTSKWARRNSGTALLCVTAVCSRTELTLKCKDTSHDKGLSCLCVDAADSGAQRKGIKH